MLSSRTFSVSSVCRFPVCFLSFFLIVCVCFCFSANASKGKAGNIAAEVNWQLARVFQYVGGALALSMCTEVLITTLHFSNYMYMWTSVAYMY